MQKTSPPVQDYLKIIYELTRTGQPASTNAIAERLRLRPASVTGMLRRLSERQPPLVTYRKRQGVALTAEGQRIALEIIRHHRLLETYLVVKLGFSWDEVHEEACRLEHVISEKLEERLSAALGDPLFDPHGAPIPRHDLSLPQRDELPLTSAPSGSRIRILRVPDEDPALLRHLDALHLRPGAEARVRQQSPLDAVVTLQVNGHPPVALGYPVGKLVAVEVLP